ncbi:MAG: hybrid sensor histidine kinase/response regulator [Cyanobacteria bacterium P01_G01_bin.54]
MSNSGQILVVDDTPVNLKVLGETLRHAGYTVATAIDGERALHRLEHYQPDLILLDIQMPGIDGFETCRRLKADPQTQKIPIIFITALTDTASQVQGLELGAVDYVTKPFKTLELLARIRVQINLRQAQAQLLQESKLATMGELVTGIAQEVDDPISFIQGNLTCAEQYYQELIQLVELYEQEYPEPTEPIQAWQAQIDLPFLKQDYPDLLDSMKKGAERVKGMMVSLSAFSQRDITKGKLWDLHKILDNALALLSPRLQAKDDRPAVEVYKNYGTLPLIHCYPEQLNQALTHLLMNLLDALDEKYQHSAADQDKQGSDALQLLLTTHMAVENPARHIRLEIGNQDRLPSFEMPRQPLADWLMEKLSDQGTGLKLAIAQQIITEKHRGTITCTSAPNQGTTFAITLPLQES